MKPGGLAWHRGSAARSLYASNAWLILFPHSLWLLGRPKSITEGLCAHACVYSKKDEHKKRPRVTVDGRLQALRFRRPVWKCWGMQICWQSDSFSLFHTQHPLQLSDGWYRRCYTLTRLRGWTVNCNQRITFNADRHKELLSSTSISYNPHCWRFR